MGVDRASNGIFKYLAVPLFFVAQFGNAENTDQSDLTLQALFLTNEEKNIQQRFKGLKIKQQEQASNAGLLRENKKSPRVVEYTGYLHIKDKVTLYFGFLPAKKFKTENAPRSRQKQNVSSQHYVLERYTAGNAKTVVIVGNHVASDDNVSTVYRPFTVESVSTDLKTASIKLAHNGQQKLLKLSR